MAEWVLYAYVLAAFHFMPRSSKRSESVLSTTPWWLFAVAAIIGFVLIYGVFPAVNFGSSHTKGVVLALKPIIALIAAICCFLAIGLYIQQRDKYGTTSYIPFRQREPSIANDPTQGAGASNTSGQGQAYDYMLRPINEEAKPQAWSIELLHRIEWKRFEELCAAFYREIGLRSETLRCGADGGIDAKLFKPDDTTPSAIVQCKAWNSRPVGVKPVRELLGVMTHEGVSEGIFIATGDFTAEAINFAKSNPLHLINGKEFLKMIQRLPDESQQKLLTITTEGDYTIPTCPSCGVKMVMRSGERGSFWGCSNYPRCKHKFFFRQEFV